MLKAIVFDFDGVIVNSNYIKRNTYYQIFSSFRNSKEIVSEVLHQFEPNTREFIIGKIVERLARKELVDSRRITEYRDKFVKEYSKICEKEVSECDEIEGALESIKKLSKEYSLYVNSLTPLEALKRIIKKRELYRYFRGIFGGEKSKAENLKTIISREKISPSQLLVVGDGILDLEVARRYGAHFIGIDNSEGTLKKEKIDSFLEDCTELYNTVKEICTET